MDAPSPSEIDTGIRRLISEVLDGYPVGSAVVEHGWNEKARMWFTEVFPAREDAAFISIGFDGSDLLSVMLGRTTFELFPVRSVADLGYLRSIVEAAVAGRMEESGNEWNTFARISTPTGLIRVGAMHAPWPWAFRTVRRYAQFGPAAPAE